MFEQPHPTTQTPAPFYTSPDFWHDVAANLVAAAIVVGVVLAVERARGKRIAALH